MGGRYVTQTIIVSAAWKMPTLTSWTEVFRNPIELQPRLLEQLKQLQRGDEFKASLSSQDVSAAFNTVELNSLLRSLEVEGPEARDMLTALNNVLGEAPAIVPTALVHHGTAEALLGIHKRIGLAHPLSPLVIEALTTMCVNCEAVMGHADALAVKQDLVELAVSSIIWMGNTPQYLWGYEGLATAHRAVSMCWSLCRHDTQASKAASKLFVSAELGPRCLHLAAALASDSYRQGMTKPSEYVQLPPHTSGPHRVSIGELCVGLMALSSGFAISLMGLGPALDTSSTGLDGMRRMMLRPSLLADVRIVLSSLVEELQGTGPYLAHLGPGTYQQQGRLQQQGQQQQDQGTSSVRGGGAGITATGGAASALPVGGSTGSAPEPAPHTHSSASAAEEGAAPSSSDPLLDSEPAHTSVEGAVRNLLTFLGVPLLCSDYARETEVQALTSFALQYFYLLFQEGFTPIFQRLSNRTSPYRGLFLTFFCAMSDLLHECSTVIGQQFTAWGVQLHKDPNPSIDPDFWAPASGGADAASAHAFITLQVSNCIVWSQRILKLMMVSKRVDAYITGEQQMVGQAPAGAGRSTQPASSAAAMEGGPLCSFCGRGAGATVLKGCPCGLASYCDKTCQTAHFPKHREKCKEARKQLQKSK